MAPEHIKEIQRFYMDLLDKPSLKDSIFHQAHCEEMVALCNFALARCGRKTRNGRSASIRSAPS